MFIFRKGKIILSVDQVSHKEVGKDAYQGTLEIHCMRILAMGFTT